MRAPSLVLGCLGLATTAAALSAPFPPTNSAARHLPYGKRRNLTVLSDDPAADLRTAAKAMERTPCRLSFTGGSARFQSGVCETGWICPGPAAERAVDEVRNVVSVSDDRESPVQSAERSEDASQEALQLIERLDRDIAALRGAEAVAGSCSFATAARGWYERYVLEQARSREAVEVFLTFNIHRASPEALEKAQIACNQLLRPPPSRSPAAPAPLRACGRSWPAGFWEALFDDRGGCERPSEWTTFALYSDRSIHAQLPELKKQWDADLEPSCRALPRDLVPKDCRVFPGDVDLSVPDAKREGFEAALAALGRAQRLGPPASGPSPAAVLEKEWPVLKSRGDGKLVGSLVDATLQRVGARAGGRSSVKILWCQGEEAAAPAPGAVKLSNTPDMDLSPAPAAKSAAAPVAPPEMNMPR